MKTEDIKVWVFFIFFFPGMLFVSLAMSNITETPQYIFVISSILLLFIAGLVAGLMGCEQKCQKQC